MSEDSQKPGEDDLFDWLDEDQAPETDDVADAGPDDIAADGPAAEDAQPTPKPVAPKEKKLDATGAAGRTKTVAPTDMTIDIGEVQRLAAEGKKPEKPVGSNSGYQDTIDSGTLSSFQASLQAESEDFELELNDGGEVTPPADVSLAGRNPTPTLDFTASDSIPAQGLGGPLPSSGTVPDTRDHQSSGSETPGSLDERMTGMWGSVVDPQADPKMTIRLDRTIRGGGKSTLVIKSRSLHEGAAPANSGADYEMLDILGEGGMGVVYAARQASVDRTVALKMLKSDAAQVEGHREKFISEAVVTSDLDHPNIVPIYDLGTNEAGALFYSMKRVRGTPWSEVIENKTLVENLEILQSVADALAFAHASGVIHRDLKPENVMLGDFGEVLVMDWGLALATEEFRHIGSITQTSSMGGTPAYMPPEMATGPVDRVGAFSDIYLLGAILYEILTDKLPHTGRDVMDCLQAAAKNVIQPTRVTGELMDIAMRAMASNPADRYATVQEFQQALRDYQAHEQSIVLSTKAAEELEKAQSSDDYQVYARSLYGFQEALTLWGGNTRAVTGLDQTQTAYARCALNKGDYELGLSLLDPAEPRYEPLRKQLTDAQREVNARHRRLKLLKGVAAAMVAIVLAVVTVAFFMIRADRNKAILAKQAAEDAKEEADLQKQNAIVARDDADAQRKAAVSARDEADTQRMAAVSARDEADEQRMAAVSARDEAQSARDEAVDQRRLAERAKEAEEYEAYIARIGLAGAKIDENAFDTAVVLLDECKPELRNWEWGRLRYLCEQNVRSYDADGPIDAVAWSPDGKRFVTGSWDGKVRMWDAATGEVLWSADHGQYVHSVAFAANGRLVASGGSDKAAPIRVYRADNGQVVRDLTGHTDSVLSVAFSQDGRRLLSSSYDNTVRMWDVAAGREIHNFRGHTWWVWSAAWSSDERQIVSASQDGRVIVWSAEANRNYARLAQFMEHQGPVYAALFSPVDNTIISAGYDKTIRVWNPDDVRAVSLADRVQGAEVPPTPHAALTGHLGAVRSIGFSPDGRLAVSGGQDNALRVWDLATAKLVTELRGHGGWIRSCAFAPDGELVLSGSHDRQAKTWDLQGYQEVRVLRGHLLTGHTDAILGAEFSADGSQVVTASRDRTARNWDAATGELLHTFEEGHEFLASGAVFFPGGKQLLTAAGDNTVRVWDVATGTEVRRLDGAGRSGAAALSTGGKWIATGSNEKTSQIFDTESGELLQTLSGHTADVTTIRFSPDDTLLMTGDASGRCILWRLDAVAGEWTLHKRLTNHSAVITAAAFTPSGGRLLTASGDRSVAQWDVATGQELIPLVLRHDAWVTSLAITPDGRLAVTASEDGKVRVWDIAQARVLHTLLDSAEVVASVAVTPDSQMAITASPSERTVRLWNLATGKEIRDQGEIKPGPLLDLRTRSDVLWAATLSPAGDQVLTLGGNVARLWRLDGGEEEMSFSPHGAVASASYSPDGKFIVTGSWDNSAKIWDAATGRAVRKLTGGHTLYINSAVFSRDGAQVLTASDDKTARLWDATTGKPLPIIFKGHTDRVRSAVFSPDGALVLTGSNDHTARIWDAKTGKLVRTLGGQGQGHEWAVLSARFSADGASVVTASEDNTVRIWNAGTGEMVRVLAGHTAAVNAAAFSPDGRRVATASSDNTAKIWDALTGTEILSLEGHEQPVTAIRFSPNGHHVLSASRDGAAILWMASEW
jgi:hypothetical protein